MFLPCNFYSLRCGLDNLQQFGAQNLGLAPAFARHHD
jgi:hypothetical protein